jgi:hypoxanthine phosphoribosyltransferase
MRLSSYGLASASGGDVRLLGDIPIDIVGRRVLLVDDIVDTCRSIAFAVTLRRRRKIGELWMCALLDKPERREVDVSIDFVGVRTGDVFVAGYGIAHAEKYRHLPYVGVVD